MPRTKIPIPLGFYTSQSLPFSAQRCVNMIPIVAENSALNTKALFQVSGLKSHVDSLVRGGRGGQEMKGVPYFINANSLVSVSSVGVATNHGAIPGNGRVSLANNGQYLVIVIPNVSAYVYDNQDLTITQITDPDFIPSETVVYKDGYFIFSTNYINIDQTANPSIADGSVFFNSALNDPFTYDALDFGTAEINPDVIVAMHVNHNELFAVGSETIEVFQNIGGVGFPFQRIPGANIQKGAHAKFSLIEFDNSFCFVGGGKNERSAIWKVTSSSSATKISTDAIDTEIQKFTQNEISNSFAMTYSEQGQFFAAFTFESDQIPSRTFVYNATASALSGIRVWFELQEGISSTGNRWAVASIISVYGKLLVSDLTTSIIGEIDTNTVDNYGSAMFRSVATQPFNQDGLPVFAGEIEATFESGVGLTIGQGSNPLVRMDYSDDGGRTFKPETTRSIGKIGEYNQRSIWRRQGRIPVSRTLRFTITDPVKANFLRLAATAEIGDK